jgi:ABC-2 type transport system permease protein
MAAFLFPLLGIALIAGSTRREEETGRLELLLSARIGRRAPVSAALVVATGTIAVTVLGCAAVVVASGCPCRRRSSTGLFGALAFVFAGLSAAWLRSPSTPAGSTPGGSPSSPRRTSCAAWATCTAPVSPGCPPWAGRRDGTHRRPTVVGARRPAGRRAVLGAFAVSLAGRRDLGSALLRRPTGPDRAGGLLIRPVGLATPGPRQSVFGWLFGALVWPS